MQRLPTDIARIASMDEPILRNLLITQRYHDLSLALRDVLGPADVNWSTFATWASKTAGQSIRNEEVPSFVRELVVFAQADARPHLGVIGEAIGKVVPTTGFHPSFLFSPIVATLRDVSASIAKGNLKVFAELAPEFVRFVQAFRDDATRDDAKLGHYLEGLRAGPTEQGGQEWLRAAFTAYFRARFESSPVQRARLVLLGNCLVGLHEQTRLQPEIKAALDAPVHDVLRAHMHESVRASVPERFADALVAAASRPLDALQEIIEPLWERIATRFLMSLALPGGRALPLGRDIPASAAAHDFLPAHLQNITNPEELVKLLLQYDRAGDGTEDSASTDWAVLDDRMNFIVNLFRASQQDATLFGPPFDPAQLTAIEDGRVPSGRL